MLIQEPRQSIGSLQLFILGNLRQFGCQFEPKDMQSFLVYLVLHRSTAIHNYLACVKTYDVD